MPKSDYTAFFALDPFFAVVMEGRSRAEAAQQNGMDRQTLSDWVHRYNATGIDGLKSCHGPGATPLLNEAEKAELKALVVKGPDPEKDKIIRWRCLDLQAEIARRFVGLLPNAELELMSGVGHAPWMDDPDHCASMTSSFLNR